MKPGIKNNDISSILNVFFTSSLEIYKHISKMSIKDANIEHKLNPSNESSLFIDLKSQEIIVNNLRNLNIVYAIVSEEEKEPIIANEKGKYIIMIDPLDGSKNLFTNDLCGSIFSVYRRDLSTINFNSFLQKGKNQILAAYALYGYSLVFTYSYNEKTQIYKYSEDKNWKQTSLDYEMPLLGKYYSINEGYSNEYSSKVLAILEYLKSNSLTLRYTGCLVADFHKILLSGGIFLYPSRKSKLKGKLRLMYENNPLSYIVESSGGNAVDGQEEILNIKPLTIHDTSPIFIGSKKIIDYVLRSLKDS